MYSFFITFTVKSSLMEFYPSKLNAFLFFKLPSAYWSGVRVKSISKDQCVVTVKHRWFNQNPFKSMYFAVQSMAAELTTGALVMMQIKISGQNISMLVANNNSTFTKKATGRITFTCGDGHLIEEAIQKTVANGEGQTIWMKSIGVNEKGEQVSEMNFEWSIKLKQLSNVKPLIIGFYLRQVGCKFDKPEARPNCMERSGIKHRTMKILITGATGLVGKELVKLLLAKGHTVNYLSIEKEKIEDKPNYKGYYWNPELGKIDESCLYEVDTIIHLAGANISKRWTPAYKQEIIESRTLSAEVLFNMVKKHQNQVKHFISASATAIYPDSVRKVYDETTKETEDSFLSYVVQKWEDSADRFKVLNIKVCKIRTGIVLSNHGGALPEMAKPIKAGFGAVFGNGKQVNSWIHLHDLVTLYTFAAEKKLEGIYNASTPNPINNKKLTHLLAKTFRKWIWLPNIPKFIMNMILGEMSYLLFTSKNLSSEKIQDSGFQFQFPKIEEAISDLYK